MNHLRNLVLEVLEPVVLMVEFRSALMRPTAVSALPIAVGALPATLEALPIAVVIVPFAAALGLPIGIASLAATEAAGMVAPGLKADMVWPILRAEV